MLRIPIIIRPHGRKEYEEQIYELQITQVKQHEGEYRDYVVKLYREGRIISPLKVVRIERFWRPLGAVKLLETALKKLNYEEKKDEHSKDPS